MTDAIQYFFNQLSAVSKQPNQNRKAALAQFLKELCPEFQFDDWSAGDNALANQTRQFIDNDSLWLQQGRYLAESICLDSFRQDNIVEGIDRYIKQYARLHLTRDRKKMDAIGRLCRDAAHGQANQHSVHLGRLLATSQRNSAHSLPDFPCTVDQFADISDIRRCGDIVFLPKHAEIIVVGDTHGDFSSTQKLVREISDSGAIDRGAYVVFLGDYVNNGVKSYQNLIEIIQFQQKYPGSVVLLSGNHEFKESYLTALGQYFFTHWDRFSPDELPVELQDRQPDRDNHYGHLRLDLIRSFGYETGEQLYSACFEWGLSLPCVCVSGDIMLSHSLGKLANRKISFTDLITCKQQDALFLQQHGYETWNAVKPSLHAQLINNRIMTSALLDEFNRALGVDTFVVGHCHYRSGDTLRFDSNKLSTIVSSAPFSADSGHYMYQQMWVERSKKRQLENLVDGNATAGYLHFAGVRTDQRRMTLHAIH